MLLLAFTVQSNATPMCVHMMIYYLIIWYLFFFPQDPSFIQCTVFSEYSSYSIFLFILMLYLLHILWTLHWIQSYLLPRGFCADARKSSLSVYYRDQWIYGHNPPMYTLEECHSCVHIRRASLNRSYRLKQKDTMTCLMQDKKSMVYCMNLHCYVALPVSSTSQTYIACVN